MKRLGVLLATVGLALMTGMSGAQASSQPLDHSLGAISASSGLPPGCYLTGATASGSGIRPNTADIYYLGMVIEPGCNPGGHFRITINFWTKIAGNWTNPASVSKWVTTVGGNSIPTGVVTFPCTHLAPVQGRVSYIVGTTKTMVTTNVSYCS